MVYCSVLCLCLGQCFDVRSDQPTPGLQFVLGSATHPDLFDTIVMANLGYFQLKAGPGAWLMRLREGRSRDLYNIHRCVCVHVRVCGSSHSTVYVSAIPLVIAMAEWRSC